MLASDVASVDVGAMVSVEVDDVSESICCAYVDGWVHSPVTNYLGVDVVSYVGGIDSSIGVTYEVCAAAFVGGMAASCIGGRWYSI